MPRRSTIVVLIALITGVMGFQVGHAAETFTCRASLVRVQGEPGSVLAAINLELVIANGAGDPCNSETVGIVGGISPLDGTEMTLPGGLGTVRVVYAQTTATARSAAAESGVAKVTLTIPGAPQIDAEVLTSEASAECTGPANDPQFESSSTSEVVKLSLAGSPVVEEPGTILPSTIPLGPLGNLYMNHTTFTPGLFPESGTVTQRALFLDTILVDVVIAEASAGATCVPEAPPGGCFVMTDMAGPEDDDAHGDETPDAVARVDSITTDHDTANEDLVGFTGTLGMEQIAVRHSDGELFGVEKIRGEDVEDGAVLGVIDQADGQFTPRPNQLGSGEGANGTQNFDDIDGLAFDPTTDDLFATVRRSGDEEDLLIKVDPETGEHIDGAFAGADYAVVPAQGDRADVDALAFDVEGNLWAIVNDNGEGSLLVNIDTSTGAVSNDREITGADDLEGLAWHPDGTLLGVSGKSNRADQISEVWDIDPETGAATNPRALGTVGDTAGFIDYEGISCQLTA